MRALVVCFLVLVPALANAQYGGSEGVEVTFSVLNQASDSIGGNATSQGAVPNTSSLSLDDAFGFGLNIGYRFNAHWSLGLNIEWLQPDYDVFLVPDDPAEDPISFSHGGDQFNTRIVGTYTFKDEGFTPYLDFGIGWTQLDSNVISGPPITGCWWHPWWGYICENFYSTFTETEFTYGIGGGVRLDVENRLFFKLGYTHWVLDAAPNASDFALGAFRLEIGRKF